MKLYIYIVMLQIFNGFSSAAQSFVRCGTDEYAEQLELMYPDIIIERNNIEQNQADFKSLRPIYGPTTNSVITIPIVVFLIGDNVINTINSSIVNDQLQVLNDRYQIANIQFCLTTVDAFNNPTTGIVNIAGSYPTWFPRSIPTDNVTIKSFGHWDPHQFLNIYIAEIAITGVGLYAGYTTFPSALANHPELDGIVINPLCFGVKPASPTYDRNGMGLTLVHEVGHWLDLLHTFGDENNCGSCLCTGTDFCDDTPICSGLTGGSFNNGCTKNQECTTQNTAVNSTDLRQIENYMDYSDDGCLSLFTPDQILRMEGCLNITRSFQLFHSCIDLCHNQIQDVGEDGIDCGGTCPPCDLCHNNIQDIGEDGIDCGGTCPPCTLCNNQIQDVGEDGIDCGGTCPPCDFDLCHNLVQDVGEDGIDCGGTCPPCDFCHDLMQDNGETGVDCGGLCTPCPTNGAPPNLGLYLHLPDHLIILNTTYTGVVNLCPGQHPIITLGKEDGSSSNYWTYVDYTVMRVPCSEPHIPRTWWDVFWGRPCIGDRYKYWVSIYVGCDENFNGGQEIVGNWFYYPYDINHSSRWNFDVANGLGFTFQDGVRYKIKLAILYNNTSWVEGYRNLYINNYDMNMLNLNLNGTEINGTTYSAASHIIVENTNISSPSNQIFIAAGKEILFNPSTSIDGKLLAYINSSLPCYNGYRIFHPNVTINEYKDQVPFKKIKAKNTNANDIITKNLIVYPNPSNDCINIEYVLDIDECVSASIYNYFGVKILNVFENDIQNKGNHTKIISTRTLNEGSYILRIISNNELQTAKFNIIK